MSFDFRSKIFRLGLFLVFLGAALGLIFGGLKGLKGLSYGERFLLKMAGPVSKGAALGGLGLRKFWERYLLLVGVERENERLRQEILFLEAELTKAKEAYAENLRLKKLLKVAHSLQSEAPVVARVIGKPLGSWQGMIIVDKGLEDNVLPEMPVLTYTPYGPGGVVGQVVAVERHYAKVLLLTDPSFAVDALVQRSRERGLLRGEGKAVCLLDYVPAEADVRENDLVVTSGLDGLFPKGLLLGKVVQIYPGRSKGLFRPIEVKPAVDFKKLEEVLILLRVRVK